MADQSDIRLLILGDSITAGCDETGVTVENAWPQLLLRKLEQTGVNVELTVSALHGAYTEYVIRRFDRMVTRHSPDAVLILLGSNDAGPASDQPATAPTEYQSNLSEIVARCLQIEARPFIASPLPRTDRICDYGIDQYAAVAADVAASFRVPYLDLHAAFCEAIDFAALVPDGQHPGPAGNRLMASLVVATVAEPLAAMSRTAD